MTKHTVEDTDMDTAEHIADVTSTIVNRWQWWQDALNGNVGPIHDGDPQQGYYRTKNNEPVAIWLDEAGNWLAYRSNREVDAEKIWTWCCTNPISHEFYKHWTEHGRFPDDPPTPEIGHNSGSDDPFEALSLELAGEEETATEFLKTPVTTQIDADRAGVWAKRLTKIAKQAEIERKTEKEPHLEAGRAVDTKWGKVVDGAKDFAAKLKRHVEPFLIAQKREEEDRQREAARQAEELRRKAQESDQQSERERSELLRKAQDAERQAEAKPVSAGRTGAKVSIRVDKVGVVTDYSKAAAALVGMNHKDMIETIDRLANRAAKSGMAFDGMEIKEVEKAV